MEITVRREDLVRDLQVIQGIVDRRGAIAILSNALLVASNDSLSLSATDLDVSVKAVCPARVKKAGATTLPARKLHDIVKALPSGSDILLRDDEEGFVTVQSERTNYKVATLPKDDFPTLPENKGAQEIALPAAVMSRLIGKTSFAITVEDARYYLGRRSPDRPATPSPWSRPTVIDSASPGKRSRERSSRKNEFSFPRKAINELKQVTEGEETVFFSRTENHLIFRTPAAHPHQQARRRAVSGARKGHRGQGSEGGRAPNASNSSTPSDASACSPPNDPGPSVSP